MPTVPYRKSYIPQPIADRDKDIAYLRAELSRANKIIDGQNIKIAGLKTSQELLLKDSNYWHRMYKDLQLHIEEVSQ